MANHTTPLDQRFSKYVTPTTPNQCWPWQGGTTKAGYGKITAGGANGRTLMAHRVAYELHHGPIPDGKEVAHECDNRLCCNPYHLIAKTHAENQGDMKQRGRSNGSRGESNKNVKLSDFDVSEIRRLHMLGESNTAIAKQFHVDQSTVSLIVNNKSRN